MAITAYVDDSGSEPQSHIYVLGGVVLRAAWWNKVAAEWVGALGASPSISYFKASDVWARQRRSANPFKNFTDEERRRKVISLAGILCNAEAMTLSCHLEWEVFQNFKRAYKIPKGKDDPYFYLYYGIILLQAKWGIRETNSTRVDFVFDEHGPIGKKVKSWYHTFKETRSKRIRAVLGDEPVFADEKCVIPLQAADLFAWYKRNHLSQTLYSEWHQAIWVNLSRHHSEMTIEMDDLVEIGKSLGFIKEHQ